jgi:hypothetical protein
VCPAEGGLPGRLAAGVQRRGEVPADRAGAVQLRERGAEPLAGGGVAAFQQQAEAQQVADQAAGHQPRPQLVADLGAAADERLLQDPSGCDRVQAVLQPATSVGRRRASAPARRPAWRSASWGPTNSSIRGPQPWSVERSVS